MRLVNLIEESFTEYKKPHMLLGFPLCSFKCDHEYGNKICQNSELARAEKIEIPVEDVVARYLSNDITKAIVLAGLEPFDSYTDVIGLLEELRSKNGCYDDVVIYTGYKPEELRDRLSSSEDSFPATSLTTTTLSASISLATISSLSG